MQKTNKSLTKRMKITKSGKLLSRRPGKCHFNAKESGDAKRSGKKTVEITLKNKDIGRYLPSLVK